MSKLFASSLVLTAVAAAAVEPAPAVPFTDGEYALKASLLAGQSCAASCNVIHHAGRFSTKVSTYGFDAVNQADKTVSAGFCGHAFTYEMSYLPDSVMKMVPVHCAPSDGNHASCNNDLCSAWKWMKGYYESHLPFPYVQSDTGFDFTADGNTFGFEKGTCPTFCGALKFTPASIDAFITKGDIEGTPLLDMFTVKEITPSVVPLAADQANVTPNGASTASTVGISALLAVIMAALML